MVSKTVIDIQEAQIRIDTFDYEYIELI